MKKIIYIPCASFITILLLVAYNNPLPFYNETYKGLNAEKNVKLDPLAKDTSLGALNSTISEDSPTTLPDTIIDSYYAGQDTPVFDYFHNKSIQRFLAMWVKEETGDIENPIWNYDSFTQITILDHDFAVSRPEEKLYCLTFSDGDRYGYIIVKYDEKGPSIGNWGMTETTPYLYDMKAYSEEMAASLMKTDIDLWTAKASRVYLIDREKKRADQVIRFTDAKGDNYIYYFGDSSFNIEKW